MLYGKHFQQEMLGNYIYKEKCVTRCKDLVSTVEALSKSVSQACKIKDFNLDNIIIGECEPHAVVRPLRQLSDQINSIDVTKNQLVRFCERLNDEHKEEFGKYAIEDMKEIFSDYPNYSEEAVESDIDSVN